MKVTATTQNEIEFLRVREWARSSKGLASEIVERFEAGTGTLEAELPEHDVRLQRFREELRGRPGWVVWTER